MAIPITLTIMIEPARKFLFLTYFKAHQCRAVALGENRYHLTFPAGTQRIAPKYRAMEESYTLKLPDGEEINVFEPRNQDWSLIYANINTQETISTGRTSSARL